MAGGVDDRAAINRAPTEKGTRRAHLPVRGGGTSRIVAVRRVGSLVPDAVASNAPFYSGPFGQRVWVEWNRARFFIDGMMMVMVAST